MIINDLLNEYYVFRKKDTNLWFPVRPLYYSYDSDVFKLYKAKHSNNCELHFIIAGITILRMVDIQSNLTIVIEKILRNYEEP
jgi:hypothetical protein